MANRVGAKGQVVISKPTRDRLKIAPGMEALERVVGDHVELFFIPPPHDRSLKGELAPHLRKKPREARDWMTIQEAAWSRAAKGRRRRKG